MTFRLVLILAVSAQTLAVLLAIRLNFRYRIYSAWTFIAVAMATGAVLRLASLANIWTMELNVDDNWALWVTSLSMLMESALLLAGIAYIEPFFQQLAASQELLRQEHLRLTSLMEATAEELRLANQIQRHLLPERDPDVPQLDAHGASEPAEWTSGDYFDYVRLGDGSMAFLVADVCGHGLGPALLMASTCASIRALAPSVNDVGELLTLANRAVAEAVGERGFVTAFVARFDLPNKMLHFAAAGQVGYLLKRDGSHQLLAGDAPPLGTLMDISVKTQRCNNVQAGDILFLGTDGIPETERADGEAFGDHRLLEAVADHRDSSAAEIVKSVFHAAANFSSPEPQRDDWTAVIVKVCDKAP